MVGLPPQPVAIVPLDAGRAAWAFIAFLVLVGPCTLLATRGQADRTGLILGVCASVLLTAFAVALGWAKAAGQRGRIRLEASVLCTPKLFGGTRRVDLHQSSVRLESSGAGHANLVIDWGKSRICPRLTVAMHTDWVNRSLEGPALEALAAVLATHPTDHDDLAALLWAQAEHDRQGGQVWDGPLAPYLGSQVAKLAKAGSAGAVGGGLTR